jgi:wyosine [tRNA(Phe)-imidazoG37] synthetase (radical SAM superfamily)
MLEPIRPSEEKEVSFGYRTSVDTFHFFNFPKNSLRKGDFDKVINLIEQIFKKIRFIRDNPYKSIEKATEEIKDVFDLQMQIIDLLKDNGYEKASFDALFNINGSICCSKKREDYKKLYAEYEKKMVEYKKFVRAREQNKKINAQKRQLEKEKKLLGELLAKHSQANLKTLSENAPALDPKRKYI